MKGNCTKTCLISVVATFAFLQGYDFLVHGKLLEGLYLETASLWRSKEEMEAFFPWCFGINVLLAIVLACGFKKLRKYRCNCAPSGDPKCDPATTCCPVKSGGLCFGVFTGLLFAIPMAGSYLWMPIPVTLAAAWFFTGLFKGIGAGVILGAVCRLGKGSFATGQP